MSTSPRIALPLGQPPNGLDDAAATAYLSTAVSQTSLAATGFTAATPWRTYELSPTAPPSLRRIRAPWAGGLALNTGNGALVVEMLPSLAIALRAEFGDDAPLPTRMSLRPVLQASGPGTPHWSTTPSGALIGKVSAADLVLGVSDRPALVISPVTVHAMPDPLPPAYLSFLSTDAMTFDVRNPPNDITVRVSDISDPSARARGSAVVDHKFAGPWTATFGDILAPFHPLYADDDGRRVPSPPLTYRIEGRLPNGNVAFASTLQQDTRDVIRQEYVFHSDLYQHNNTKAAQLRPPPPRDGLGHFTCPPHLSAAAGPQGRPGTVAGSLELRAEPRQLLPQPHRGPELPSTSASGTSRGLPNSVSCTPRWSPTWLAATSGCPRPGAIRNATSRPAASSTPTTSSGARST
jgi:hypothetical protein